MALTSEHVTVLVEFRSASSEGIRGEKRKKERKKNPNKTFRPTGMSGGLISFPSANAGHKIRRVNEDEIRLYNNFVRDEQDEPVMLHGM